MEKKEKHHSRSNPMAMPTVVLGIIMIVMLVFMISINTQLTKIANSFEAPTGNAAKDTEPEVEPNPTPTPSPTPSVELAIGDSAVKGDEDAPVEIYEFSEFQCPFCKRFYDNTWDQILDNYLNDGKVKVIFKHFPLGFHANAQKASEATECAKDQGKFWEYHDVLFETAQLDMESLKKHAEDLGLDTEDFNTCLDTGKYADKVKEDFDLGRTVGVSGTPSFFINGKKVVGAQPYEVFKAEIDAALG